MTNQVHHLKVEVFREDGYWVGLPVGAPGSMSGDTLPEFFADVEFSKHFSLGVPQTTPVRVEFIPGQPEITEELHAGHRAFRARNAPVELARYDPFLGAPTEAPAD